MKTIELTQGYLAIVDDEDYLQASQYLWCYSCGYAVSCINGKLVSLHRFILNYTDKQDIDHINNNGLDNNYPSRYTTATQGPYRQICHTEWNVRQHLVRI